MSGSRQERRQLGRSLKLLAKVPFSATELSSIVGDMDITAEDVRLAAGRCAACLSTSGERKSCHACSFVRYCNRECQTAGWPSHKLVCRVLAADREIATTPTLLASAPLLPLDTIWERLRSGGHAEAFQATVHLHIHVDRCGPLSSQTSMTDLEHISALRAEIFAADGVALLVKGLAAGGLRASVAAGVLDNLSFGCPEMGAAIVAAGALPPLVYAVALTARHASLGKLWSLFAAAVDATWLLDSLVAFPMGLHIGPALVDAGADLRQP